MLILASVTKMEMFRILGIIVCIGMILLLQSREHQLQLKKGKVASAIRFSK